MPVPASSVRRSRESRGGALAAGHLSLGYGGPQAGVAGRAVGQHEEVLGRRVGGTGPRPGPEREFGAEHGGEAVVAGRLGEADHAVETVVVG